MTAHACFRCDRPIEDVTAAFCSRRCLRISLAEFGPLHRPKATLQYDYSSYDPEDDKYGDYDPKPDASPPGLQLRSSGFRIRNRFGSSVSPNQEDDDDELYGSDAQYRMEPQPVADSNNYEAGEEAPRVASSDLDPTVLHETIAEHEFGRSGVCNHCGHARVAVKYHELACTPRTRLVDQPPVVPPEPRRRRQRAVSEPKSQSNDQMPVLNVVDITDHRTILDASHIIERILSVEMKCGVCLDGLSAQFLIGDHYARPYGLKVLGSLRASHGDLLRGVASGGGRALRVQAIAYDALRRVIAETEAEFSTQTFFGMAAFTLWLGTHATPPDRIIVIPRYV